MMTHPKENFETPVNNVEYWQVCADPNQMNKHFPSLSYSGAISMGECVI